MRYRSRVPSETVVHDLTAETPFHPQATPGGRRAPLRTLFLSSCVLGGGAGWSLYYLLKHLDRQRFDPIVVVPPGGIFDRRFAELDLRVEPAARLPHRTAQLRFRTRNAATAAVSYGLNVWDSFRFVHDLHAFLDREQVELLYCNNMMVKTVGALAANRARVPCVFHVRNLHERLLKVQLYGRLARLPIVKRIIANSSASAAPYRRFAADKVRIIHNGVDLDDYHPGVTQRGAFRAAFDIAPDATVIGFTGLLTPRKGLEPLIRAAAEVLRTRPRVLFVAAGRVPYESAIDHGAEYHALARSLGIADRFRFLGFLEDVRPLVADCDVLVLPSFQEPFGRSVIEAMALGTAVVASRVGGLPEIVEHGVSGMLTPPGDVPALAAAIATLVDDPVRRAELAACGLERVHDHFDIRRLNERVQDVLLQAATAA